MSDQSLLGCELTEGLEADAIHQGIANRYPVITCCNTVFNKVDSTKAAASMNNQQLNPTKDRTGAAEPRLEKSRVKPSHSAQTISKHAITP